MSSFNEQILDLMAIRKPCIQIRTSLEKEMIPTLLNLSFDLLRLYLFFQLYLVHLFYKYYLFD